MYKNSIFFKRIIGFGFSPNRLASKVKNDCNMLGRSMIEMLGVLAIIAVLSVGGIAGYSKALRMWRSTVQKNMIAELLTNMIKIKQNLNKNSTSFDNITHVFEAMGAIPEGITYKNNVMYDKDNNTIYIDYGLSQWTNQDGSKGKQFAYVLRFYYNSSTSKISPSAMDFCLNMIEAAKQIANDIVYIKTDSRDSSSWNSSKQNILYNKASLATTSLTEMQQKCNMFFNEEGRVLFSVLVNPY